MKVKKKLSDMSKAEKARDFVEFTNGRRKPFSLSAMNGFYSISVFFTILIGFLAFAGLIRNGFTWDILFLAAAISTWHFLYFSFKNKILLKIASNQSQVEYKFFAIGAFGGFFASIMWLLYIGADIMMYELVDGFIYAGLMLLLYLISSVLYVEIIILFVNKGAYAKATKIIKSRTYLTISAFTTAMTVPIVVLLMSLKRLIDHIVSQETSNILFTLSAFCVVLGCVFFQDEFVAYYYCKKYKISCDENGNFTLPPPDEHNE